MLSSIDIEGFRGIKTGSLHGLTELVVVAGPNSAGKSTILDAIFLAANPDPSTAIGKVLMRRVGLQNPQDWLFWRSGRDEAPHASIRISTSETRVRQVDVLRPKQMNSQLAVSSYDPAKRGTVAANFFGNPSLRDEALPDIPDVRLVDAEGTAERTPLHALYTRVAERGLRREAKGILTELVPDLEDVEILTQGDQPVVYLVYRHGAQPVALAGDGIRHLLYQSLQLAAPAGGIVLLEEPEVHMHPAAIRQIARAMWAAVGRGIQIILTTHSLDVIDALIAAADAKNLEKLSFFRVQLEQGVLRSHRLSGSEASLARTQIEDDLR